MNPKQVAEIRGRLWQILADLRSLAKDDKASDEAQFDNKRLAEAISIIKDELGCYIKPEGPLSPH